jgi:hypothetical protein
MKVFIVLIIHIFPAKYLNGTNYSLRNQRLDFKNAQLKPISLFSLILVHAPEELARYIENLITI